MNEVLTQIRHEAPDIPAILTSGYRGQADTWRLVHRLQHVVGEAADRIVDLAHGIGDSFQPRVGVDEDGCVDGIAQRHGRVDVVVGGLGLPQRSPGLVHRGLGGGGIHGSVSVGRYTISWHNFWVHWMLALTMC